MTSMPPAAETSRHSVAYSGIEYPGEVVTAERWTVAYGAPLVGDAYFRVVFLRTWPRKEPGPLQDSRISVCIPGPGGPGQLGKEVQRELRVLLETQAQYVARRSDPTETLEREVEEQTKVLEVRLSREWGRSYAAGRILSEPPLEVDPAAIFGEGDTALWAQRLGEGLLARAYPALPINAAVASAPILPERDAPLLFDGLMLPQASSAAALALDAFAPALGLASLGTPRTLNPAECPAFHLIEAVLSEAGGVVDGWTLGRRLAHLHGLTYPLATLFTLCWLGQAPATQELRLRTGHGLRLRDGGPLESDRLSGAMVQGLAWPRDLWADVEHLGSVQDDPWESALPYLQSLNPQFRAGESPEDVEQQRRRLRRLLVELRNRVPTVSQQLDAMAKAQGREGDAEQVRRIMGQLRDLAQAGDEAALREQAQLLFGGIRDFRLAMAQWHGWSDGLDAVPQLIEAMAYLEGASIPEQMEDLLTDREALRGRLQSAGLVAAPHQWPGLLEAFRLFRRRYATAYLHHHEAYHGQMGLLAQPMADIRLQARALEKLNGIRELGKPVAPELPALAEELHNNVVACAAPLRASDIERSPRCEMCGLRLGGEPPTQDVELLAGYVRGALRRQNQRLSRWVVRRLLRREPGSRLERFISVVQVSDLSGLANVLDEELVQFIRELLEEWAPHAQR